MNEKLLAAACAAADPIVAGVRSDDLTKATPCAEWSVQELLNHMVGTLTLGRGLLSDSVPDVAMGPGDLPPVDLLGGDPTRAYRDGVKSLLDVATAETTAATHVTPMGELPGPMLTGFTTLDLYVHGWDLAMATGQVPPDDEDLASGLLAFAHRTISDDAGTRAPRIGPEVAVPENATATARLVGYLGRRP